jgi:prepilin-type N-terminal cleavage/methylation domain-containing protein
MRRLRSDKSGITLVELVVAMVIAGIVITMAGGILIAAMNMISRSTQHQQDITLAENVLEYLANNIEPAAGIENPPLTVPGVAGYQMALNGNNGSMVLYIGNDDGSIADNGSTGANPVQAHGYLWVKPDNSQLSNEAPAYGAVNAFGSNFYQGRTISMDITLYKEATAVEAVNPENPDSDPISGYPLRSATITVTVHDSDNGAVLSRSRSFRLLNDKVWHGMAYKIAVVPEQVEFVSGPQMVLEIYKG